MSKSIYTEKDAWYDLPLPPKNILVAPWVRFVSAYLDDNCIVDSNLGHGNNICCAWGVAGYDDSVK